jgi:hypothetical protein
MVAESDRTVEFDLPIHGWLCLPDGIKESATNDLG